MNFQTILDPPILFFCLGAIAVLVRSNIEIPKNTTKFLSYYLLMSIGFKGGMELSKHPITAEMYFTILAGVGMAVFIPLWMFYLLRTRLDQENAAAVAACYGSVSAVTFVTGVSWLENRGFSYGGHMVALMALMESPAIIMGVVLGNLGSKEKSQMSMPKILHDAFFNGSVYILIGSLLIGYFAAPKNTDGLQVFVYDMFKGFLSFFLLDLGISAARQIKELKGNILFLSLIAILAPLLNGVIGLFLARQIGLHPGDGFLFIILCASASYIAVPAALKICLPQAQAGYYLSLALGLTFPFNILFGLPIYWSWASNFLS